MEVHLIRRRVEGEAEKKLFLGLDVVETVGYGRYDHPGGDLPHPLDNMFNGWAKEVWVDARAMATFLRWLADRVEQVVAPQEEATQQEQEEAHQRLTQLHEKSWSETGGPLRL